jgi:hypothetical protein
LRPLATTAATTVDVAKTVLAEVEAMVLTMSVAAGERGLAH